MRYPDKNLKEWMAVAEGAALNAGRYLRKKDGAGRSISADLGREVKISADRRSEENILKYICRRSEFTVLTEESGTIDRSDAQGLFWVVDPLDGSLNFLRGLPISCVSIALCDRHGPVLGVIYDFNRGELFKGVHKKGAWLNGKKIRVSSMKEVKKSILFTGIPVKADTSSRAMRSALAQIKKYRKARWIGSAALSMAYVAAGRGDAYLEKGIMFWDVAAGLAIVSGAGGKCRIERSDRNDSYNVYVSNGSLYRSQGKRVFD